MNEKKQEQLFFDDNILLRNHALSLFDPCNTMSLTEMQNNFIKISHNRVTNIDLIARFYNKYYLVNKCKTLIIIKCFNSLKMCPIKTN